MPPDVKNSLNDNEHAMFKALNWCVLWFLQVIDVHAAISIPKKGVSTSLMIQRTLGILTTI